MNKILLAIITYLQIFASMFSSILLTLIPGSVTYKDFVLITSVISTFFILYNFFAKPATRKRVLLAITFMSIITLFYTLTGHIYKNYSDKYDSFFLVIIGQAFPTAVTAAIVACNINTQNYIKRAALFVAFLFTIVSLISAFMPSSMTSGGYMLTDSGLNYQQNSYLSAYATSLSLFYLFSKNNVNWFFPFNCQIFTYIPYILIILNFLTILISGGRGGLALFVILFFFTFYMVIRKKKLGSRHIFKYTLFLLFIGILGYLCVQYAINTSIETSGFERIVTTIHEGDNSGRDEIREDAFRKFSDSPIIGHGLGSVFFEIGEYSHNIFTDILVDAGFLGLFIFIGVIFCVVRKSLLFTNINSTDVIWLYIFIDGFIMSLFSGYYIASMPIIWFISFITSRKKIHKLVIWQKSV